MKQYTEADVSAAISLVNKGISLRKTSWETGVPKATVQNRLKGRPSHQIAYTHLQALSDIQEKALDD